MILQQSVGVTGRSGQAFPEAPSPLLACCCATSIGQVAFEILSTTAEVKVAAASSGGIFLTDALGRVIFLSFERFRGPITITASSASSRMKNAAPGSSVLLVDGWMVFQDLAVAIPLPRDLIWMPVRPRGPAESAAGRKRNLEIVIARACAEKDGRGWSRVLTSLIADKQTSSVGKEERIALECIGRFRTAMERSDGTQAGSSLKELLGLGQGLTPSGDDMVAGLLLALNRWREVLCPQDCLEEVNLSVVECARSRTTALSATLIECAARGLAGERMIQALDSIMTGVPSLDDSLPPLLQWGASSGTDSLLGMAVAMSWQAPPTMPH